MQYHFVKNMVNVVTVCIVRQYICIHVYILKEPSTLIKICNTVQSLQASPAKSG